MARDNNNGRFIRTDFQKIGEKYGQLTFLGISDEKRGVKWCGIFKCDCGDVGVIPLEYVRRFKAHCSNKANHLHGKVKHNMSFSGEYKVRAAMIDRCHNENCTCYGYYGGRGISVCDRWRDKKDGLMNFLNDIGMRPSKKHTLERIDNDGNYEPENVRWATRKEQANNRGKFNFIVTYNEETMNLSQWGEKLGLSYKVLHGRLVKLRWPIEKALTTPKLRIQKNIKKQTQHDNSPTY